MVASRVRLGRRWKKVVGPTRGAHASAAGGWSWARCRRCCRGRAGGARLGRCRPRSGLSPLFFNRNKFLLFSFLASKQKQNKHQQINKIKQKLCSSMNAYKHVSTLYLILFNFVNYLINAKEIQTKPKIKLNSN